MEIAARLGKWFLANWERALFVALGLGFFGTCFYLLHVDKVTEAAVVFGLGFLSFLYANITRFKRFKGLGFEAELWEDKKKEAADLIERLRDVVSIYTREVMLGKITAGRWAGKPNWAGHWKLYSDLIAQHDVLGQKIDFSDLKKAMDDYFLFDMTAPEINKVRQAVAKARNAAQQKINQEFGSPIRDLEGHRKRMEQYRAIQEPIQNPFEFSTRNDLAGHALNTWHDTTTRLKRDFEVEANIDPEICQRLEKISALYKSRPVEVTDELVRWANREE